MLLFKENLSSTQTEHRNGGKQKLDSKAHRKREYREEKLYIQFLIDVEKYKK